MANSTTRRSIELEPKTLNQGQLSQARKVAEDVVQKLEPKEASSLFIEGLEQSVEDMKEEEEEEDEEGDEKRDGCIEKIDMVEEKACNIDLCSSLLMVDSPSDQLHHIHQHEPLSAPF